MAVESCHFIVIFSSASGLKRRDPFAWELNQSIAGGHWVRLRAVIRRCDGGQWLHPVTQLSLWMHSGVQPSARWAGGHLSMCLSRGVTAQPFGNIVCSDCALGPPTSSWAVWSCSYSPKQEIILQIPSLSLEIWIMSFKCLCYCAECY